MDRIKWYSIGAWWHLDCCFLTCLSLALCRTSKPTGWERTFIDLLLGLLPAKHLLPWIIGIGGGAAIPQVAKTTAFRLAEAPVLTMTGPLKE